MQIFNITKGIKGSIRLHNYNMMLKYVMNNSLEKKIKILDFEKKHGLEATIEAFEVSRASIYIWKKKLKENNSKIECLKNKAKGGSYRVSKVCKKTIKYIETLRNEKGKIGKEKIEHLLKSNGIDNISASTVGRILKKLKEEKRIDQNEQKVRINGATGKLVAKQKKKTRKKRLIDKYFSKANEVGNLQIDTIVEIRDGIRKYIIQAIDVYSRICFSYAYSSASSLIAKDFFIKLQKVLPYKVKRVQVDNGSEFEKDFSKHLSELNISIFKTYPKSPKMNAKVERLNRTTQEEFYLRYKSLLWDNIEAFNKKLVKWVLWYNTERPHWSLKFLSPLKFYCREIFKQKYNLGWTCTCP